MINRMKSFFLTVALAIMICSSFCCEVWADQSMGEQYFLELMEAIKNRDMDKMLEWWSEDNEDKITSAKEAFEISFDCWNGREMTSYKKISEGLFHSENKEKNVPDATMYEYEMTGGDELFRVKFAIVDKNQDTPDMVSYEFYSQRQSDEKENHQSQWEGIKWGLIIFKTAEIVLSFYIAFLCFKDRPKWWGLWIFFILVGYGGVSIAIGEGLTVGAFVYLLRWSTVLISPTKLTVYLSLPIGAIAYCIKRKKVKKEVEMEKNQEKCL